MIQFLGPDGQFLGPNRANLDCAELLDALRWMLLCRQYDKRATQLQRQGRWGVHSPATGQEASVIGSAMAIDPKRDWIVPQYREGIALVHHGYPLPALCAGQMGKPASAKIPEGVKCLPNQTSLAAQLPHAVGLAWGLALQSQESVVLTYLGEGASSEGDFHESLNLAGLLKAPVVFFLQNNQWAISTPRNRQSRVTHFADRAIGYGIAGSLVDGNDVVAVHHVVTDAVSRARQGDGPTLIEAVTYRLGFHNTSDDPHHYREDAEFRAAEQLDPISRLERYVQSIGCLDRTQLDAMLSGVVDEVEVALSEAEAMPATSPLSNFDNAYASPPPRVLRQRRQLEDEIQGG